MSPVTLGRPIAEQGHGYPALASQVASGQIVSLLAPIFTIAPLLQLHNIDLSSGPWESVNDPIAFPFVLGRPETVYQIGWRNGSSATLTNVDVGIYDAAWNRVVSTGSTAITGSSVFQWVDIADTPLLPGRTYYLVESCDQVTSNRISRWPIASTLGMLMCGVQSSATDAFPLPDPLTNMGDVAVFTHPPVLMMALRASPL